MHPKSRLNTFCQKQYNSTPHYSYKKHDLKWECFVTIQDILIKDPDQTLFNSKAEASSYMADVAYNELSTRNIYSTPDNKIVNLGNVKFNSHIKSPDLSGASDKLTEMFISKSLRTPNDFNKLYGNMAVVNVRSIDNKTLLEVVDILNDPNMSVLNYIRKVIDINNKYPGTYLELIES